MVSMSGDRPPCTQNTAPDSVDFDPPDVLDAPVPGGPVRTGEVEGVPASGEEEPILFWEDGE
jgi:hypothetical protein